MVYVELYKTGKSGIRVIWLILLLVLIHKLLIPIVPHSWNFMIKGTINPCILIKRRPFIYIILNFIIISILISSSSFTHKLTNLVLKIHTKYYSYTTQKTSVVTFDDDDDDDTWWASIVNNEGTQSFTMLHGSHETVSFESQVKVEEKAVLFEDHAEGKVVEEEVKEEVNETLDDTWKAIMEARRKESRPQLKKSETWTSGYRGGRLTYHDELKQRADAFIERVNQEMRLQRMESHQRFLDIINRGL